MRTRNLPAQAQAQSATFARRSCAAKKSIENVRQLRRMDSLAGVGDAEYRAVRVALQADVDRSSYWRELQRVVEQIDDQAAQMAGVDVDENVLARIDGELDFARLRQRSDRRRDLAQQRAKIEPLSIDHHFAVEPRQHQQLVGNPAERQRLAMRRAQRRAI